jgi:hypothetical protein
MNNNEIRRYLCAPVADVDRTALRADLKDDLGFKVVASAAIIVPEIHIGDRSIPNDRKDFQVKIILMTLTFLVWAGCLRHALPHSLNAAELREGITGFF